jgi:hypothetical protein
MCCAALLLAAPAAGVIDPDPDGVGVYFDTAGDIVEIMRGPAVPFEAYVILTNPTGPVMNGFEFAYALDTVGGPESSLIRLQVALPPGVICIDCNWDPLGDNVRIVWATPLPTMVATPLITWGYMILVPMQVDFRLAATPFTGPDTGQIAYLSDGAWIPMQISSGDPTLPVASVNGTVLEVVPATFAGVKAIYR